MSKARLVPALLLLLAFDLHARCVSRVFVQPPPAYAEAAARARSAICAELAPRVPAAQAAVAVDGRVVWYAGFGYADLEKHLPVSSSSMFRIGSISKPFAADVFALLVQNGTMDPDAQAGRYLPSLPEKLRPITARQLAGHLSGIRHYAGPDEIYSNKHFPTVEAGLVMFENDPLLSEPGKEYHYSTYGYSLLSAMLEKAAGRDFPTLLRTMVFEPLALTHSALDDTTVTIPERAVPYEAEETGDRFTPARPVDSSYKWAGGGVISTAEDIVKFGSSHLNSGRLTQPSLDLLFTSQKTADGAETHYGAGWEVGHAMDGHLIAWHNGSSVGGSARLMIDRDTHVVVGLVTNATLTGKIANAMRANSADLIRLFHR